MTRRVQMVGSKPYRCNSDPQRPTSHNLQTDRDPLWLTGLRVLVNGNGSIAWPTAILCAVLVVFVGWGVAA